VSGEETTNRAGIDVEDFGILFERFLEVVVHGRRRSSPLAELLTAHLGVDPSSLSVVVEPMTSAQRPNLQVAVDAFLATAGRESTLVGVQSPNRAHEGVSFAQALQREWCMLSVGTPEFSEISLGEGEVLPCLDYGIYLVEDADARLAILVSKAAAYDPRVQQRVEVIAQTPERASETIAELRRLMRERNVYRGKIVRFEANDQLGGVTAVIQSLPRVTREQVVLEPSTLERIERQTLVFSEHRLALLAAGRHLRRGLLLHGPPGTGKTHTLSYLIGAAQGWTAILISGWGFRMLSDAVALARELQPAIVVLEDVDLVAEDRALHQEAGQGPLLFDLLNEMDGLENDADIVFALTTNRVDVLERALIERPGRIDLAVEIRLPDAAGRRRLIELYAQGLDLQVNDLAPIIAETDGMSASFVKELLRRATLLSAVAGSAPTITDEHLRDALDELRDTRIRVPDGLDGSKSVHSRAGSRATDDFESGGQSQL
jgi:chromosomal replication initiation ATPase DnaA